MAHQIAEEGDHADERHVEGEGVDGDGGGGRLADGVTLVLGQQSAAQLLGQVVEVGDKSGLFVLGRPFHHEQSADDRKDNPRRGRGHRQAACLIPPETLKSGTDGRRRAMPAIETGGEHDAERIVEIRPDQFDHKETEQAHAAPLQQHADLRECPHGTYPLADLLHRDVGRGEGQRAKHQGDQDRRIGADLTR